VPVVEIEAADEQEAARKLLRVYSAVYGQIDAQGLYDFATAHELDVVALNVSFPDFDMYQLGAIANEGQVVDDLNAEWQGMPEFEHEDLESYQKIIVHFPDEASREEFAILIGQNLTEKTKFVWYPKQDNPDVKQTRYASES